jgi:hypothetical protein
MLTKPSLPKKSSLLIVIPAGVKIRREGADEKVKSTRRVPTRREDVQGGLTIIPGARLVVAVYISLKLIS